MHEENIPCRKADKKFREGIVAPNFSIEIRKENNKEQRRFTMIHKKSKQKKNENQEQP